MALSITDNFAPAKRIIKVVYIAISDGFIYLSSPILAPLSYLKEM